MCFGLVCFCVSIVFVVLVFFFLVRLVFCIFFFDILVGLFCSSFLLCCLLLVLIRFLGDLALRLLDSILSKNDAIMGFSWFFLVVYCVVSSFCLFECFGFPYFMCSFFLFVNFFEFFFYFFEFFFYFFVY